MDVGGALANIAASVQMEELPEDVIHHIIGLLSTVDATRFSILSKPLRSFCLSFPVLDLDFTLFSGASIADSSANFFHFGQESLSVLDLNFSQFLRGSMDNFSADFFHFVKKSLQVRRPHIKKSLQKLRFSFTNRVTGNDNEFEAVVDSLLEFALEKSVKELDLNVSVFNFIIRLGFLKHSPSLLRILSLKSVTSLKLKGFESGLSDLSLTNPSLEYLSIDTCIGLITVRVSSKRLKNMKLNRCDGLESVHVEAELLESFLYVGAGIRKEDFEIDIFACRCLQNLTLVSARLSTKFFEQLIRVLHLQFLCLRDCFLPERLNICHSSLKTFTMRKCFPLEIVVLSAKSVRTFIYEAKLWNHELCELDISACTSLSKLELIGAAVTDSWVKANISALTILQELVLHHCRFLENTEFESEKLVRLALLNCHNLKEASIDARNLFHFSYSGSPDNLSLIITSSKFDARISLSKRTNVEWFGNLTKFLPSFNHCKSLTLCCHSAKDLIFPPENFWTKLYPLPDVRHLIVELKEMTETPTLVQLVENLLWFVPNPVVITINISGTKQYSLKFQYSNQIERKEIVQYCCNMLPIKCWRHHVEKIIMDNFGPEEKTLFGLKLFAGYLD